MMTLIAADGSDFAGFFRDHHGARVAGDAVFQAGGHQRRLGHQQRHGLALHVGTHQRAVGVVVFQERNQRRGDGHQLLGRNVHVIHPRGFDINEVGPGAANDPVGREFALVVNRRIRLRDDELFLAVGGQVINVIGDAPVQARFASSCSRNGISDAAMDTNCLGETSM